MVSKLYSGGFSDRAPPLPISYREVKPVSADGTAFVGEQVAAEIFYIEPSSTMVGVFFFILRKLIGYFYFCAVSNKVIEMISK